jgi:hypothetical protein
MSWSATSPEIRALEAKLKYHREAQWLVERDLMRDVAYRIITHRERLAELEIWIEQALALEREIAHLKGGGRPVPQPLHPPTARQAVWEARPQPRSPATALIEAARARLKGRG